MTEEEIRQRENTCCEWCWERGYGRAEWTMELEEEEA